MANGQHLIHLGRRADAGSARFFVGRQKPLLEAIAGHRVLASQSQAILHLGQPESPIVKGNEIRLGAERVLEIESTVAAELIQTYGIVFGEDGISTEAIRGA